MRAQRRSSEPAHYENGSRPVRGSPSRSEDPKAWRSESAARLGRAKNGSRGPVTKIHREMEGGDFCLSSSVCAKFCRPGLPISEDECFFFPPGIRRADLTWEFHLLLSERKEEVRVSCLLLLFLSILSVQLLRHV